jgi:death-on-curing protein
LSWRWIPVNVVKAIHDRQLSLYGGLDGIRDAGALESALARPQNLAAYGDPDAADLAAAYAFGIARNHAFNDGNKRTAWVTARSFLEGNGFAFTFEAVEYIAVLADVARGGLDERELAEWFRARLARQ